LGFKSPEKQKNERNPSLISLPTLGEHIPYNGRKCIMKILAASTLTSKKQLTVPKVVRQLLDIHVGDSLVWSLDEQGHLVVSAGCPNSLVDTSSGRGRWTYSYTACCQC
jgi:hypothetical protein